jgi:hypothetical protein
MKKHVLKGAQSCVLLSIHFLFLYLFQILYYQGLVNVHSLHPLGFEGVVLNENPIKVFISIHPLVDYLINYLNF